MKNEKNLAVFVDMDNVSVTALQMTMSRWRFRQTNVILRRAYGGLDKFKGAWPVLVEHGFHIRANHGKGTTDVLMAVDVMDVLHMGALPHTVVIASSDAAFVPLAWRLRDAGHRVVCVAEHALANVELLSKAYHEVEWCDVPGAAAAPVQTATMPNAKPPSTSVVSEPPVAGKQQEPQLVVKVASPSPSPERLINAGAESVPPKAVAMVAALQPWLPLTVKQLNQVGTVLREKKLVSGSKPLHEHFRQFPEFFKVLPPTGPAQSVKLLKVP